MGDSSPPRHEITRPLAQAYDPGADNAPLAALLNALSSVTQASAQQATPAAQASGEAQFTAQLCSALSLRPDSLFSNFQRNRASDDVAAPLASTPAHQALGKHSDFLAPLLAKADEGTAADHSSAVACNSISKLSPQAPTSAGDDADEQGTQDTSSNDVPDASGMSSQKLRSEPLTEEAKKKRRQEINRESARRVRRRKSLEQQQLQQKVAGLQTAASSAAADQAVIVRYASELTRERDALLQRASDLESKWIAAECRNIVLRQRIAEIKGVPLQEVSADTGQLLPAGTLGPQDQ